MPVQLGLDAINHFCLPSRARINSYSWKRAAPAIYGQMFNPRHCGEWQVAAAGAGWRGAPGREGGRGLEITCWWGSVEPLCKHCWNENKVVGVFFFFLLWRPVRHPSTTLQAEVLAAFQKGTTVQEIRPMSLIQYWLCAWSRPSMSVIFLLCGHKEWKKRIVIVGGGNSWYNSSELE